MKALIRLFLTITILHLSLTGIAMAEEPGSVTVEWYGHSCFLLTLENGYRILIDPFDASRIPYQLPTEKVNVIFSTHDHFDHNAVDIVPADYVLRANGFDNTFFGTKKGKSFKEQTSFSFDLGGVEMSCSTVPSFHDERQGELRGANGIIRFTVEDMIFVHLGDLGEKLSSEQVNAIRPVDVLMIPVGGYYTIDAEKAKEVVASLEPRVVIPMHFKTPVLEEGFPIEVVSPFVKGYDSVIRRGSSQTHFQAGDLPDNLVVEVLKYHGQD